MDALHGRAKRCMGQKKWCSPHPPGAGGEGGGISLRDRSRSVTTKSSPGLANAKSSGSLKTVPPQSAMDSNVSPAISVSELQVTRLEAPGRT